MKFKDLRKLIYAPCKVITKDGIFVVSTHYDDRFDELEVIGVRSRIENDESYIEVNLNEVRD